MYIFHIICFLLLWSKSATSFRSMCLPVLWASFKQWRISRYVVSACPTWISCWIPGFTSFLVKKKTVMFLRRFPCMRKCCQAKDQEIPLYKCHCTHTCIVHLYVFFFYIIKLKKSFVWNVYVCPDLIYLHREHVRNIFQIVGEYYKFGIFLNYNNGRCEHKSVQFHVLLDID